MEQQIKEEIKEYMFSFYSGILPICSEERINESVYRILKLKEKYGIWEMEDE